MTFEEWHEEWVDLIQADITTMREIYDEAYKNGWRDGVYHEKATGGGR